ncbi:MAG TPA: hypothetical protein DCZ94_12555 [Lentisphaeria bacterium]|nr:MAG: hypothetical protein A2X48_21245 [Lentisphaerae bacterium GWF2_49_21]HBC87777.1 hypothetical protein [Lentisphaeria bacterium]
MNKKFILFLLVIAFFCHGCSKQGILSPSQFTGEFVKALKETSPGIKVEVVNDLELKVTTKDGKEFTSFLDNAYNSYKQDPESKAQVITKYVAAGIETANNSGDELDRDKIVPVVKDRPWLNEMRQTLLSRGAKSVPDNVYDDFGADMIIMYAHDSTNNIRYLTAEDLATLKIEKTSLRALSCENLKKLLPEIERHGDNGFYMLTAGGDYDASILLLDSVWDKAQIKVKGDFVVAIPSRDLLLVTGSQDSEGLEKMRKLVQKAYPEGTYRLTNKLFVRKNKTLEEFLPGGERDAGK